MELSSIAALAAAAMVALLAVRARDGSRFLALLQRLGVPLLLLLLLSVAVRSALALRGTIAGVDFYAYATTARDLAAHLPVPETRHIYFPGVYLFWGAAIRATGGSLASLQAVHLCALALTALLCAAVVGRATRSLGLGLAAALWYFALALRLEGLEATTEPIGALPALLGVALWGGQPLRGKGGLSRALLLGAGLGTAVFIKQQAGLLALGWLALAAELRGEPGDRGDNLGAAGRDLGAGGRNHDAGGRNHGAAGRNHDAGGRSSRAGLLLVPLSAALVFGGAMAATGGLAALRSGLAQAAGYPGLHSPLYNLGEILVAAPDLIVALCFSAVCVLRLAGRPRFAALREQPGFALLCFTLAAASATLLQLWKRGYHHYALLTAPFAVIATCIAAAQLLRALPALRQRPLVRALPAVLLLVLLADLSGRAPVPILSWRWAPAAPTQWPFGSPAALDLDELRADLHPGDGLLLLPPRRNAVHFLLGTRSLLPLGYLWGPTPPGILREALQRPGLRAVLVLDLLPDADDRLIWDGMACEEAVRSLPQLGFEPRKLRTMTLWTR